MSDPLGAVWEALGEVVNDVQTRRRVYEEDLVQPLRKFPVQDIDGMDTAHDQCVKAVQAAMTKLHTDQFKGQGPTAILQLMDEYFAKEKQISNYNSNGISQYITDLTNQTGITIHDLQSHLDAISGFNMSNVIVNDVVHYWSDVFQKGPSALIDDLQIGPWTFGQLAYGNTSQTQSGQMLMPQGQIPPGETPLSGFGESLALILAPFAGLIIVVNIITEIVKQCSLEYHLEALALAALNWVNAMNDLHNNILTQNSTTHLAMGITQFEQLRKNAQSLTELKMYGGLPDPRLSPKQQKLVQELYAYYSKKYPNNPPTLVEIEYIVSKYPSESDARYRLDVLGKFKTKYPQLPDGYLAFFVMQPVPLLEEAIDQNIQWLQKAKQNTQGKGPGNIYYMQGQPLQNPYVDFLAAETYYLEALAADKVRHQMKLILEGNMDGNTISSMRNGALKKFLLTTLMGRNNINRYMANDPKARLPAFYDAQFGTAVQEEIKAALHQAPWTKKGESYYIAPDEKTPGSLYLDTSDKTNQRPDIQLKLHPNQSENKQQWAAMDYTTYNQTATKKKYSRPPYAYNIVLVHNGPFGKDEYNA
jgi:hypothetical protein